MRKEFLRKDRCTISSLFCGSTIDELIEKARKSKALGADAVTIELKDLQVKYRNFESLKCLINNIELPTMFCFYRNDTQEQLNDEERQKVLLMTVDAGASFVDVMGDLYDPSPMEITYNAQAIKKQIALIDEIHQKGAKVIISSHMQCARTAKQIIAHLQEVEKRNADIVKIVTTANYQEDLQECFDATKLLKNSLKTPFVQLCGGSFSRPHRFTNPLLGEAICFAIIDRNIEAAQPQISEIKTILDNLTK